MRKVIVLTLCFLWNYCIATDRYFATAGNDSNAGTIGAPWKTIAKFNSAILSASPGDNFYFNRGDIFTGGMIVAKSGSAGNLITIAAYGTGANPKINGFATVSGWTSVGTNVWESNASVSTLSNCNMVVINGVEYAMGTFPNNPYLTFQSHVSNTTITSSSLNSTTTNWTGAKLVIRNARYIIDVSAITGHSAQTLSYNSTDGTYLPKDNWGFFIEDDSRTLDVQNEWYYNPTTKRIRVYSTSSPTGVQVSTVDILADCSNFSFITFNGIDFTGANNIAINTRQGSTSNNGNHITINNCVFSFCGRYATWSYPNTGFLTIRNCNFSWCNADAIQAGASATDSIDHNTIINIGTFLGMGSQIGGTKQFRGIVATGNGGYIDHNKIYNCGYEGIDWDGSGTAINRNLVNNFGFLLDDGGGIYTTPSQGFGVKTLRRLTHNIVLNGIGNHNGAVVPNPTQNNQSHGFYLDTKPRDFSLVGNTVYNTSNGLMLNNTHEAVIDSNKLFNNAYSIYLRKYVDSVPMSNLTLKYNNFIAKGTSQQVLNWDAASTQLVPPSFVSDSNTWNRNVLENNTTFRLYSNNTGLHAGIAPNFGVWSGGQDSHSITSTKIISDTSKFKFVYNPNDYDSVVVFGDSVYEDERHNFYNGSIILHEWSSQILIFDSTVSLINPTVDAGSNQTITSPTSSVTLTGTATSNNSGGSITSVTWNQTSGPTATIALPHSLTTGILGLIPGNYRFQLFATDNFGSTGSDTVHITVNDSIVQPPVADAGSDVSITLPTTDTLFHGSASDPDGTVVSHIWSQISGPNTSSITTPSSYTSAVTGLIQGVYQFKLFVTNNGGATDSDTMQITVNPGADIPPVADAGTDSTIRLPRDSVHLLGSGTDMDGTIVGYHWRKVSGPGSTTILNPNNQNVVASGLQEGIYEFELQVTDNNGATGLDTVEITVLHALPHSNAGVNQSISIDHTTVNGSASTGTGLTYQWTQLSGPSSSITDDTNVSTTITGMSNGTYVFQLEVTDDEANISDDTIQIIVNIPVPPAPGSKLIITHGKKVFLK